MENRGIQSFYGTIMGVCTIAAIAILLSVWNTSNNIEDRGRIAKLITMMQERDTSNHVIDKEIAKLETELKQKDFQQEFILHQVGIQSDWIILYVTLLFALVVAIEFINFKTRLESIADEYKNKQKINDEHFREFRDEFKRLKTQNADVLSTVLDLSSAFFMEKGLVAESVKQRLMSVSYITNAIDLTDDKNRKEELIRRGIGLLGTTHQFLKLIMSDQKVFLNFVTTADLDFNIRLLDEIARIKNAQFIDFIMEIRSIFRKIEVQMKQVPKPDNQNPEPKKGKATKPRSKKDK